MQVSFDDTEEFLDSYAGNVGIGGLMLRTAAEFLTVGHTVRVQFRLPGTDREIVAVARVVWRHEPGTLRGGAQGLIGLGFDQLTDDDREVILDYVSQSYNRRDV